MSSEASGAREAGWSRILTSVGIVIAVSNMALAWIVMFKAPSPSHSVVQPKVQAEIQLDSTQNAVATQGVDQEVPPEKKPESWRDYVDRATKTPSDQLEDPTNLRQMEMWAKILERADELERPVRAAAQSIVVVSLAFSFALIAIGFSLFVMGVQGASSFKHEQKDFGALMIKTTSPGLLCIMSAAILIGVALSSQLEKPEDPESAANAEVIRAKAQLISAEADAKRTEAYAKSSLADAKADLLSAGASVELIDRLMRLAESDGSKSEEAVLVAPKE